MLHYIMENQNLLPGATWIHILQETLIKRNPLLAMYLHLREEL